MARSARIAVSAWVSARWSTTLHRFRTRRGDCDLRLAGSAGSGRIAVVSLRLLYLIMIQVFGWLLLLGR